MKIRYLKIVNFKSIRELTIRDIENALILVGKNNTGKTAVIDALLLASGMHQIKSTEFLNPNHPVEISVEIEYSSADLMYYHQNGILSKSHDYDLWLKDLKEKLPSLKENVLSFTCKVNPQKQVLYIDGFSKNNPYIVEIFPKIYHIDQNRNLEALQNDVISFYHKESFQT